VCKALADIAVEYFSILDDHQQALTLSVALATELYSYRILL